jgi:hypothetical protein
VSCFLVAVFLCLSLGDASMFPTNFVLNPRHLLWIGGSNRFNFSVSFYQERVGEPPTVLFSLLKNWYICT